MVRPTVFLEGFFRQLAAPGVQASDVLALPMGRGRTSPISAVDVARAVAATPADAYDDSLLSIRYVDHFAETRIGIRFKDTGECGLYSLFNTGDRFIATFYRCDQDFGCEELLRG